jgi:hypothetical protein
MLATCLSACVTARVEESRNASTYIGKDESVVVLATSYHAGNRTEAGFLRCIADELDDTRAGVKVQPRQEFVDALFPWFEPRTMPQAIENLADLLARPGVRTQISQRGVRYLVWISGSTERTSESGGLSCAAGPGGGGCIGFAWWESDGSYQASVWDLRQAVDAGQVKASVHGTSMVPALIIPLPLIARTEAAACKGLARELREFIGG